MIRRLFRAALVLLIVAVLVAVGFTAWSAFQREPLPLADRCTARGSTSVSIDPDQARNASIIAGLSVKRGLIPRAAVIALATAYQESGLRNLDHGDRDSLGLFQQRPSQDWGTAEQVMDPYYATNAFYDALVKVSGWQTADINDTAQAVQRSGFPEAYRQHVSNATALGNALTGMAPASFSCALNSVQPADPYGLGSFVSKTFGERESVLATSTQVRITTGSAREAWAVAHASIANARVYGVTKVSVGTRTWVLSKLIPSAWSAGVESTTVTVTFAA